MAITPFRSISCHERIVGSHGKVGQISKPPMPLIPQREPMMYAILVGLLRPSLGDIFAGVNQKILSALDKDFSVPSKLPITLRMVKNSHGNDLPITGLPFPGRHPIFWMFMSEAQDLERLQFQVRCR